MGTERWRILVFGRPPRATTPCLKKRCHLLTVCNFVKSSPIFKIFASLESIRNFPTKSVWHDPPPLRHVATLPWELKIQIFCRYWRKRKQIAVLVASSFVIHLQILIFSVSDCVYTMQPVVKAVASCKRSIRGNVRRGTFRSVAVWFRVCTVLYCAVCSTFSLYRLQLCV